MYLYTFKLVYAIGMIKVGFVQAFMETMQKYSYTPIHTVKSCPNLLNS